MSRKPKYDTLADIRALRDLGWDETRIAAHYKVSVRQIGRWEDGSNPTPELAPPLAVNYGIALIVNDAQYPYYDPALWEVTCQIANDAGVTRIFWDGDMLDFPQLGSYNHDRYRMVTAEQEVNGFHERLREPLLKAVGTNLEKEFWSNGNHEDRYERYRDLNDQPTGTQFFPTMKEFLKLPELVEFAPWGKASGHMLTPRLLVAHGWYARKHSAATAKAHAEEVGNISVITGHTHRVGAFYHETIDGVQASYEVGHMSDESSVPKAVKGRQNWQQVAGTLVYYSRKGESFDVEIMKVIGHEYDRVLANGREYRIER